MTTTENYYGFNSSDEINLTPNGIFTIRASDEKADDKGRGFIVEWDILDGDFKGTKFNQWFLVLHDQAMTKNIALKNISVIAKETGRAVTPTDPVKGRILKALLGAQKNDPSRIEVKKFYPEDYQADSEIPA